MCPLVSRIAREDRDAATLQGNLDLLLAVTASKNHAPRLAQADGRNVLGEALRLVDVAGDALSADVFVDDDLIRQIPHESFKSLRANIRAHSGNSPRRIDSSIWRCL